MTVIWELDFYSRPVVDEQNKKLWEVLICESPLDMKTPLEGLFRYSKFCANTEVNSVTLQEAIQEAIANAPAPPDRIRFFRRQMANMILRGCEEAQIPANASRRTLALNQWLQQRMAEVYPAMPNYQPGSNPSVSLPAAAPKPLPDALLGQQWAFVTLKAGDFADMNEWQIDFGEAFPLELANLDADTPVPGLLIFSPRALPLAGWMSGLELAYLTVLDGSPAKLVLETGASESWIIANLSNAALQQEGRNFEAAKQQANQVHFIGVQSDPNAEAFAGFWLLQELNLA